MIFGLGGHSPRPTRDELEHDAAAVIAELVASGRPPPEVWRKAEQWRAANPPATTGWYTPAVPSAVVAAELRPRVVRMALVAPGLPDHGDVGDGGEVGRRRLRLGGGPAPARRGACA